MVDLITWDKGRIGMGYRTRRRSEYLVVAQKLPKRAKGCWTRHDIPDVWLEKDRSKAKKDHPHEKPQQLLRALIEATTEPDDLVLDPAAGSFAVKAIATELGRSFVGCDLAGPPGKQLDLSLP